MSLQQRQQPDAQTNQQTQPIMDGRIAATRNEGLDEHTDEQVVQLTKRPTDRTIDGQTHSRAVRKQAGVRADFWTNPKTIWFKKKQRLR